MELKCKICKKKITSGSKLGFCSSCSKKGKILSKETIEKIRISNSGKNHVFFGKHLSEQHKCKLRKIMVGKKHTESTKAKISFANQGKKCTKETKKKLRICTINRINNSITNGHSIIPGWNLLACQKIDEYGKKYNYNFQHAMNGGEFHIENLGYWVDGYDKQKNTVIEYYEKHHENQIRKDLERETEICNYLGCDFIILWE